jgi:hypothetical protein
MAILKRPAFYAAFGVVVIVVFSSLSTQAGVPHGWFLAGNKPASYDSGIDTQSSYNGRASAYLKSKETHRGFWHIDAEFRRESLSRQAGSFQRLIVPSERRGKRIPRNHQHV